MDFRVLDVCMSKDNNDVTLTFPWGTLCGPREDYIFHDMIKTKKMYETELMLQLEPILARCTHVVDAGAHVGTWTLFMSKLIKGVIFAFEPQSQLFNYLNRNMESNGIKGYPFQLALIHKPMEVTLSTYFELDNQWISLQSENAIKNYGAISLGCEGERCKGMPLDLCVPFTYRIDFIKLDVETCEMFTLHGGEKILRVWKPALLIEYHPMGGVFKRQHDGVLSMLGDLPTDANLFTYLLETLEYKGMVKLSDHYWYTWHHKKHKL
jgi:FkbM family methyltransferase